MEQIAKLLFALTLLSVFSYLLIYTSMSVGGNGGEYWGFNGRVEPHIAASNLYKSDKYELLALDIENPLGGRVREIPKPVDCTSIAGKISTITRLNQTEAIHGHDSVRLAQNFSEKYNRHMNSLIRSTFGFKCVQYVD